MKPFIDKQIWESIRLAETEGGYFPGTLRIRVSQLGFKAVKFFPIVDCEWWSKEYALLFYHPAVFHIFASERKSGKYVIAGVYDDVDWYYNLTHWASRCEN